jgi:hypothetical protein
MIKKLLLTTIPIVAALLCSTQGTASAAQVANFNFDGDPLGAPVPTTFPGVDTLPQDTVYAVGGFPDVGPLTGTVTVQNVPGMNHAAVMNTNQGGTGALYIDTQMLVPAASFTFSFDINVLGIATAGFPQAGVGALNGQAFAIQLFGLDSLRILRFAVSPTSDTTGNFGYRLPGAAGDLVTFGSYTEGETHHIDFAGNFNTGLMNVYLDGSLAAANAALVSPGTGISEIFMFQNGIEGQTNSIALDNITLSVPDSGSTVALFGIAFAGLAVVAQRQRRLCA